MEPPASCLSGFFKVFLFFQIIVHTQATSSDIQINIQVPDTEGVLVECASGGLAAPDEMIWRDSEGNIIPPLSISDSQDRTGLLYLKGSILLRNRTHGPISCSIYNKTTKQEKKKSIVLPDVLFKPEYISLMSNRLSCPVIYLIIVVLFNILRGIFVFCCLGEKYVPPFLGRCTKCKKDCKTERRLGCELIWECLLLVLYIAFLPLYLKFRSRASMVDDVYPLYISWMWDVCIILVVMMTFFTVLILLLLWILNRNSQKTPETSRTKE
ncbi:selection and upkeep of intraepithelial T-cells protein 10-like [Acomys russatus]|uniref:selection and upkeep of intraepithelial T-cells protein 10-like n=1 Tax=Acomys russatus TaxID=60746 RepID=UPI0021E24808|nr:selection and upkeep of intraepithelial T-cells protein 10-like [Acomys russatus]